MNRRALLVGLGSAAAASAVGTGAFSAAQLDDREANISVSNDSGALIGLVPNPDVSGVNDDGGELTIDLDDPGINQNSIYQFGFFASDEGVDADGDFPFEESDPSDREDGEFGSAFLIANQTDNEYELKIDYELDQTDDDQEGEFETSYWFEVHHDDEQIALLDGEVNRSATVTLDSGEVCGVSFLLKVPGDTLGEEINGSLAVSAGEAVGDE